MNVEDAGPDEDTAQVPRATEKDFLTDKSYVLNYDMSAAPIGVMLLLLSHPAGITHKAKLTGRPEKDRDIVAWAGLPDRDRAEETKRGLFSHTYKPSTPS